MPMAACLRKVLRRGTTQIDKLAFAICALGGPSSSVFLAILWYGKHEAALEFPVGVGILTNLPAVPTFSAQEKLHGPPQTRRLADLLQRVRATVTC